MSALLTALTWLIWILGSIGIGIACLFLGMATVWTLNKLSYQARHVRTYRRWRRELRRVEWGKLTEMLVGER